MNTSRLKFPAAACLLALTVSAWAAPHQTPAKKTGYETYRLLQTRNIFDPERQPGVTNTAPVQVQTTPSNPDYAALTGTMITAEKTLAFFSGSRTEYNAVLTTNGRIAGAKVTKITAESVEVERNGKRVTVAVGQTVPLDASSMPTAAPASTPSSATTASPSNTSPNASSTSAPSGDREAVMRRMMEKRQQELK